MTAIGATPWRLALLFTLAVALVLRLAGLGSGLWFDEIATLVESVRLPLWQILTEFPGVNAHPLYSVLSHFSLLLFGDSAWALRLPAAVFGVATVGMVYALGARLTSRPEAWAGAAALATSYHHVWFSQNARGYTLLGCLVLLSTLLLLRAAEAGRSRDYVLYAVTCTAGVYTHLTMAFVLAGQAIVVMGGWMFNWKPARQQPLRPLLVAWTGTALVSGAAYLPFLDGLLAYMTAGEPSQAAHPATASWALSEAVRQMLTGAGVAGALVWGLMALAGASSLWRHQPFALALLAVPGVVTIAALVGLGNPVRPRFVFFLAGAAAICAGRGVGLLAGILGRHLGTFRRPLTSILIVLTIGFVGLSAVSLLRNYQVPKQDFEGAVQYLDRAAATGARVAAAGPACFPFEAYHSRPWPCLATLQDWHRLARTGAPVLIVHTLTDYVEDPTLRAELRTNCPEVIRFPGTVGGGDIVVCSPPSAAPVETGRP